MNSEVEDHIRKNVPWQRLPTHIKQIVNNSTKEYDRFVIAFSIKNQLRYRGNLVRHVFKDEKRYYERLITYSREHLMLFPYHLADMIVKGLRITPFNYYISVLENLMLAEKSYDTLPNFTAADCLRLLGIGRNEYIELMNKSRSNRGRLFGKRNVRCLLPAVPVNIHMEPWWRIEVGLILEEDVKMVNDEELAAIDKLIDFGSQNAGELDFYVVLSLYKKGLIYLDVPITTVDRVQVPPLQGFVMNRIMGDYFETLLYKIFVSIDDETTVGELATVLEVEPELVKQAVSLYCRLQFARKLDPEKEQDKFRRHPSWQNLPGPRNSLNPEVTPLTLNLSNNGELSTSLESPLSSAEILTPNTSPSNTNITQGLRIAFLFDSALTAFLMMGNLSPGLKKHAVTMFEVGKLQHESVDSFLVELEKVSVLDAEGEGEARRFFDHAVILRSTILALRKLPGPGIDLIRLESLNSLDEAACQRLLRKKYRLLVCMAPIGREVRPAYIPPPPILGPAYPEVNSLWFRLFCYHITGYGPPSLLLAKGTVLKRLPRMFLGFSRLLVTSWLHEPAVVAVGNFLYVNATLQFAPVLVQGYGVHHPAETRVLPFPFSTSLGTPQKNGHPNADPIAPLLKHPCLQVLGEILDLEHSCGYLTFANVGVLDFGRPKGDNGQIRLKTSHLPQKSHPGGPKANNGTPNLLPLTKEEKLLLSPVESHFAVTPVGGSHRNSPTNGFISQDCNSLLEEELEQLAIKDQNEDKKTERSSDSDFDHLSLERTDSIEILSPTEENVGLFCREDTEETIVNKDDKERKGNLTERNEEMDDDDSNQMWTLLDCHFGVPLFDADANTKICDAIVNGGLATQESLDKLMGSSKKLGDLLLDFISQCQYFPGENMEIMKRGTLVPLPRRNLMFDNGRVSEWIGK